MATADDLGAWHMTRATATFLVRLKKFLEAQPEKRAELGRVYQEIYGRPLHSRTLDHWLAQDRGITLCCALPLLRFMQLNDQIIPGTKETGLFHYVEASAAKSDTDRRRKTKLAKAKK